ncbi:MAG: alternative ribosome rescue aminoacyl-tRNA hydrolase ArfB [Armatimonadota bacterium]|nr:alternative ribosome rescue aminoacyl-tRNA hydrolase ArfB [Armatimonadota bacterium]MDR7423430.1 alternative ribosome rescue aminoacyl-tRNA hydrolase ArfB [Armatimonadota bacterium]MDR7454739.1 alternative ribosome rescue aminoacyl-tRNA hydrolase ArfB [Armatimonadota bacterium]
MLVVAPGLGIDERELHETFVRASGPGGQNVNKVATAVQLRFDVERARSLPAAVRARLRRIAGNRISAAGILVIDARRFRTREQNRQDARQRLRALLERAAVAPAPRRPTRPTAAARQRRLDAKRRRAGVKVLRASRPQTEE